MTRLAFCFWNVRRVFCFFEGTGVFRLRASYFPVMESSQRSPELRPRTPGGTIQKGSLVESWPARVQTCGSAYFPRPLPLCGG